LAPKTKKLPAIKREVKNIFAPKFILVLCVKKDCPPLAGKKERKKERKKESLSSSDGKEFFHTSF